MKLAIAIIAILLVTACTPDEAMKWLFPSKKPMSTSPTVPPTPADVPPILVPPPEPEIKLPLPKPKVKKPKPSVKPKAPAVTTEKLPSCKDVCEYAKGKSLSELIQEAISRNPSARMRQHAQQCLAKCSK